MNGESLELESLKSAWSDLERRVATDFDRVERLAFDLATDKTRHLLRRAMLPPIVDLLAEGVGLVFVIIGLFQVGSATFVASLFASGAVLVALMLAALAQIAMLVGTDPAGPVLATQRRLGRVRALRIFEWKWVLLLSPVFWGPFFVVAVELTLKLVSGPGVDTTVFSAGYLWTNLVVGAALSVMLARTSGWLARRYRGSRFIQGFLDDLAGRRLTNAREFLGRLDGFERR